MKVCMNGKIVPIEQAKISVVDHGFLYGYGLFETLPAFQGMPFLLDRHLTRLRRSAAELRIPWQRSNQEVEKAISALLIANGLLEEDAYIRITVTRGEGPMGLAGEYNTPTEVIFAKRLLPIEQNQWQQGRDLPILETVRTTPETPIRVKSLQYLNSLMAYQEAQSLGYSDGIMLTTQGWIAEGTVSNLFFVKNDTLYTPSLTLGILPGITREVVMELTQQAGIVVEEMIQGQEWLLDVEEGFTTSSLSDIMPIRSIAGRLLTKIPGPITTQLSEMYRRLRQGGS